ELGRSGSTPGFVPPGLGGTPLPYGGIQAFQTNAADATSRANWGLLGLLGLCGLAGRRGRNES
ncbi:WGxxGxxG-CTERM domain-containing protein, partial [Paenibacillus validus]|nr:WGxxGxxG-CTERM domain-containing protein [Paenibacillus validus]